MTTRALRALRSPRTLIPAAAAGMLAAFTAISSFAFFTRWWTDDFCGPSRVRSSGLLRAEWNIYMTWSGRWLATGATDTVTMLPMWAGAWFPPVLLAIWVVGLAWSAQQLLPRDVAHRRALGWLLGTTVATAAMATTPDPEQTVGWIIAAATYLLPLALATPIVGLAARAMRSRPGTRQRAAAAGAGALAFLAACCTETLSAAMCLLAASALVALVRRGGRRAPGVAVVAATLAGGLAGTLVVALAPGNYLRATAAGYHPHLLNAGIPALRGSLQLIAYALTVAPAMTLLAFTLPLVLAVSGITVSPQTVRAPSLRTLLGGALGGIAMLWASFAPAFYGTSQVPPPRALLVPIAMLMGLLAAGGHLAGAAVLASRVAATPTPVVSAVPRRPRRVHTGAGGAVAGAAMAGLLVALVALGPVRSAALGVGEGLRAHRLAQEWDARDATIRAAIAAQRSSVSIPVQETTPHQDERLATWFPTCASVAYGIRITQP